MNVFNDCTRPVARSGTGRGWPVFPEFVDHLRLADLSEKKISDASGQAKHFLSVWKRLAGISRRLRIPLCVGSGTMIAGVRHPVTDASVRCTAAFGVPGRDWKNAAGGRMWCGEGFRLLDEFLEQLKGGQYSPFTINTTGASAGISSFGSTCPGSR